ncbi:MAG: hypothetical protein WAU01_08640 [Saprospiraceae bacterium]
MTIFILYYLWSVEKDFREANYTNQPPTDRVSIKYDADMVGIHDDSSYLIATYQWQSLVVKMII